MAEDSLGRIIDRKYRLLSELGRGAMGVVYRAEQLDIEGHPQRQVALKTLREELASDPDFSRRFLREVRVTMQLRNPHTVTVYDSGRDETGQFYYSMELIRGQTLKDVLQHQGPLPVERAVGIVGQICEGLAEAHNLPEPVVHRDLKPANIFIEQRQGQEWVKVGDFGIAKVLGEQTAGLTQAGASPGTPLYMAPEQWRGEAIDGRTDLYALGIMIYEMLTGRAPFTTDQGLQALAYQHLQKPPPPLPAAVPAGIRMQVERLLAKTPHERPPDALSVRRALEAAVTGADEQGTVILGKESSASPKEAKVQHEAPGDTPTGGAHKGHQESGTEPPSERFPWRTALSVLVVAGFVLIGALYLPTYIQRRADEGRQRGEEAAQTTEVPKSPPEAKQTAEAPKSPASADAGEVVQVPAGEFWMGCNEQVDTECFDDEKPGRRVTVDAFKIDRTEVTVAAYRRCVQAEMCSRDSFTATPSCTWGKEGGANHPINCVDWNQARAYCEWAGKRLPTEVEWEKATRGTDGRTYPWGNQWDARKANTGRNEDGFSETAPVGSFPAGASPYGALDMSGNVFEWTADWYDADHTTRSLRGGSWNYGQRDVRASNRYGDAPGDHRGDVGFRCAQ